MKRIATLYFLLIPVIGISQASQQKTKQVKQHPTTLDSLQGHWYAEEDHRAQLIIRNRNYTTTYEFSDGKRSTEYYRMYFSDTLASMDAGFFKDLRIDTNLLSGNYLITRSLTDPSEFWTYEIYGFTHLQPGPRTLSLADTWARKRPTLYIRRNK